MLAEAGSLTMFLTTYGVFWCEDPYLNVRGVGCIRVVDDAQYNRTEAHSICIDEYAKLFYAENPVHLNRLYTNFLFLRAEKTVALWVATVSGFWVLKPTENRSIGADELEPSKMVTDESHTINPITGKLVGRFVSDTAGYICEKKYP
ncbi:uncharacterized protein LOC135212848 [Macrobrachium nipponense]|uniref:uncharacterized protein LOC135212848 n=1 Tax=Macrobrachium nipponense TaxID=159736 RepID=UPI0030C87262